MLKIKQAMIGLSREGDSKLDNGLLYLFLKARIQKKPHAGLVQKNTKLLNDRGADLLQIIQLLFRQAAELEDFCAGLTRGEHGAGKLLTLGQASSRLSIFDARLVGSFLEKEFIPTGAVIGVSDGALPLVGVQGSDDIPCLVHNRALLCE